MNKATNHTDEVRKTLRSFTTKDKTLMMKQAEESFTPIFYSANVSGETIYTMHSDALANLVRYAVEHSMPLVVATYNAKDGRAIW